MSDDKQEVQLAKIAPAAPVPAPPPQAQALVVPPAAITLGLGYYVWRSWQRPDLGERLVWTVLILSLVMWTLVRSWLNTRREAARAEQLDARLGDLGTRLVAELQEVRRAREVPALPPASSDHSAGLSRLASALEATLHAAQEASAQSARAAQAAQDKAQASMAIVARAAEETAVQLREATQALTATAQALVEQTQHSSATARDASQSLLSGVATLTSSVTSALATVSEGVSQTSAQAARAAQAQQEASQASLAIVSRAAEETVVQLRETARSSLREVQQGAALAVVEAQAQAQQMVTLYVGARAGLSRFAESAQALTAMAQVLTEQTQLSSTTARDASVALLADVRAQQAALQSALTTSQEATQQAAAELCSASTAVTQVGQVALQAAGELRSTTTALAAVGATAQAAGDELRAGFAQGRDLLAASREAFLGSATALTSGVTSALAVVSEGASRTSAELQETLQRGRGVLSGLADQLGQVTSEQVKLLQQENAQAMQTLGLLSKNLDGTATQTRELFFGAKAAVDELKRVRTGLDSATNKLVEQERHGKESVVQLETMSKLLEALNEGLAEQTRAVGRTLGLARVDQGNLISALDRVNKALDRVSSGPRRP